MTDPALTDFIRQLVEPLKHCKALGIQVIAAEKYKLTLALPYKDALIGNSDTGVIHGGVLTTLLDTACGFASVAALDEFELAPTLDLRIDYMRPATPHKTVIAEALAFSVTTSVIFSRALAFHEDERDKPIAGCTASFMRLKPKGQVDFEKFGAASYE